jgi:hypothetical protein
MKTIPVLNGPDALVDDQDYELVSGFRWYNNQGYAMTSWRIPGTKKKKGMRMHRLILNPASNETIDHVNGNRRDNRRCNLRLCTIHQNNHSRGPSMFSRTGFKGVKWVAAKNKFRSEICVMYKRRHLGYFDTAEEAARRYDLEAINCLGQFAKLNLPQRNRGNGGEAKQ